MKKTKHLSYVGHRRRRGENHVFEACTGHCRQGRTPRLDLWNYYRISPSSPEKPLEAHRHHQEELVPIFYRGLPSSKDPSPVGKHYEDCGQFESDFFL